MDQTQDFVVAASVCARPRYSTSAFPRRSFTRLAWNAPPRDAVAGKLACSPFQVTSTDLAAALSPGSRVSQFNVDGQNRKFTQRSKSMRTKTHPVLLICCALLSTGCCRVATLPDTQKSVKVESLVHYVNLAWASHACRLDNVAINLQEVKLTLHTKNEIVADGSIDLVVVSADNKEEVTSSETLVVTLSQPDVGKAEARAKPTDFEQAINVAFDHVTTAATAIHDVELADSALQPLPFAGVDVTVGFDVVLTQTGALTLQLGSIKLGPSLSRSVSGSQEMVLTFKAKKPADVKLKGC